MEPQEAGRWITRGLQEGRATLAAIEDLRAGAALWPGNSWTSLHLSSHRYGTQVSAQSLRRSRCSVCEVSLTFNAVSVPRDKTLGSRGPLLLTSQRRALGTARRRRAGSLCLQGRGLRGLRGCRLPTSLQALAGAGWGPPSPLGWWEGSWPSQCVVPRAVPSGPAQTAPGAGRSLPDPPSQALPACFSFRASPGCSPDIPEGTVRRQSRPGLGKPGCRQARGRRAESPPPLSTCWQLLNSWEPGAQARGTPQARPQSPAGPRSGGVHLCHLTSSWESGLPGGGGTGTPQRTDRCHCWLQ